MSKHHVAFVALPILAAFGCSNTPEEPTPGPSPTVTAPGSSTGSVSLGDLRSFERAKGDFLPSSLRVPGRLVKGTYGSGTVYRWAEVAPADKHSIVQKYVPELRPSKMYFPPEQVAPDGSRELTLPIDSPSETKIYVVPQATKGTLAPLKIADFQLDVVQPSGTKLLASSNDVHVLDHEGHADDDVPLVGSKFQSIRLDRPAVGMHVLRFKAAPGVEKIGAIVLSAKGVQLDAVLDRHSVVAGEPVSVRAKIVPGDGQTVGSAVVKAKVVAKSGATVATLVLHDDGLGPDKVAGDHEYTGEIVPDSDDLADAGFWTVMVEARGTTGEGAPFLRHVSTGIGVSLPIAKLTGKVNERKGEVESTPCFQFVIGVEAAVPSRYRVRAVVTTDAGEALVETSTSQELVKGQNRVILAVPQKLLEGKGTSFKVVDLQLVSMDTEFPVARIADAYVTKSSFTK